MLKVARADYGVDAPAVVRNLAVIGAALSALSGLGRFGGAPFGFARALFWPGLSLVGTASWMLFTSRVLKLRQRDRLIDALALEGDERVLDVGCGRGLLLVGAARRLPRGRAVGLDLWRSADQSGNDPDVTRDNARAEGVEQRIELTTGDMLEMPFESGSFDAVVSSYAIHNLPGAAARSRALAEIARVLAPGGRVEIIDIGLSGAYARELEKAGLQAESSFAGFAFLLPTWRTRATRYA
jgi:ubiquinone/menaquinone biosynthesis C-methylase UbiE